MSPPLKVGEMQAKLAVAHDLLEVAKALGVDPTGFETRLSVIEQALNKPELKQDIMEEWQRSIEAFIKEVSEAIAQAEHEMGREPSPFEAEVYEYVMKLGGMSISYFSQQRGVPRGDVERAVKRLVELDMIEVRGVSGGKKSG